MKLNISLKSMFRARPPSIFHHISQRATPATEFARCHRLTQPWQCDSQKWATRHVKSAALATRNDDGGLRSAVRLPRKMQLIVWKRRKSIAPATQKDFGHVMKHVGMSQSAMPATPATPATQNEATRHLNPPKVTSFTELAIGTAIRASHGRLRTVADVNATSSEHTLNPQTPRVKREPLLCLRFREKHDVMPFLEVETNESCRYAPHPTPWRRLCNWQWLCGLTSPFFIPNVPL